MIFFFFLTTSKVAREQWGDEFNLFYIFLHKLLVTVRLHILSLKFQRFGLNQVEKMKSLEKCCENSVSLCKIYANGIF